MTEFRPDDRTATAPAPRGRRLRRLLTVTAVAAATAAVITVALPTGDGDRERGFGGSASREAVALLENVALAAEHRKAPDGIRDDQFVYLRSKTAHMREGVDGKVRMEPIHLREVWLSVDGSRAGLLREDNENGTMKLDPQTGGNDASTTYRNLRTLPTDPGKMLTWLREHSDGGRSEEQQTFVLVGDLARESLMPPDVAAALFRAAARIPGVVVVPDAVDATGRRGVAVARTDQGSRAELIFDRKTNMYLGERVVQTVDVPGSTRKGGVTGTTAVLQRAIVDKVGQRP